MTALAPNHYNIINAIQGTLSNVRNSRNKQNYATIKQPMQLMLLEFAEKPFTNVYRLTQLYLQSKNRTLNSFAERTYVHFCHHHHHDHHYHHHHHGYHLRRMQECTHAQPLMEWVVLQGLLSTSKSFVSTVASIRR